MAPNVTLHFFASNDLNGSPLLEITDEDDFFKSFTFKPKFQELGGAELVIARNVGFALFDDQALQPESFCRYLIHAYSDTDYYGGFFLDKRSQTVIHKDESGAEEFHFGGPGPKYYLDRSALGTSNQLGGDAHVDLENGVWRWDTNATAGRILNYLLLQDAARTNPALPDLTNTFDPNDDSNGDPWTTDIAAIGDYEIPIGESYLDALWHLEDAGDLYTVIDLGTVASPKMELNAYNALGDDVTSNVFASGKVLLREGVNIANDSLVLEGNSLKKPTHVIVEGKDGNWVVAVKPSFSSGDYVKWAKISHTRSSSHVILEKAGLNWLRNQELGEQELTIEILPGFDDGAGLYFPTPDGPLWLGNSISVDTTLGVSHSPIDLNNEACLVTGFEVTTGEAGDDSTAEKQARSFKVKVLLNKPRGGQAAAPNQSTAVGTSGGGGVRLCGNSVDLLLSRDTGEIKVSGEWNLFPRTNANDGDDDSVWSEAASVAGVEPSIGVAGAYWATDLEGSATAGGYRVVNQGGDIASIQNVATEIRIYASDDAAAWSWLPSGKISADPAAHGWDLVETYTGSLAYFDTGVSLFDAPAAGRYWLFYAVTGGTKDWDVETLELWANLHSGSDGTAARCDHTHNAEDIIGLESGGDPTFGTPAIVLGTAAADGSIDEVIRRDSTIVAFDATAPVTQAFGDAAATGSAAKAARRDHKHGMPSSPAATYPAVQEQDGTPNVSSVSRIKVPNGTLTDETGGVVSLAYATTTHTHGGGSGGGIVVPDLINSVKASADTPDAEFSGSISPFTAVDGSSGTASLLNGSGAGLYDVSTRSGWVLMQLGTAVGDGVDLKQDYTLPDGKCIVAPIAVGYDLAASQGNNEVWAGIAVNDNDSGPFAGTAGQTAACLLDAESGSIVAAQRVLGWDGTNAIGQLPSGGSRPRDLWFFRIDRAGLVYHLFVSADGWAWTYLGSKTMATAANNVWLFGECNATMANRMIVSSPWFRQGTGLANDPWPLA